MTDKSLTEAQARARLIPNSDYVSCNVAFIDCKTPGSHLKENYSMIGPGVTSSKEQVINLREKHGFNVGAAAMPTGITNNLHIHFTAEVFIVYKGDWKFRWGPNGDDGEIIGHEGDLVSVPTWIFRGFTNVGPDDGWIFTVLGGDDTGGIIWHPSIINGAAQYGLYLDKLNRLIDTSGGEAPPPQDELITPLSAEEIARLRRYTVEEMSRHVVTRAERVWSRDALLDSCLPGHASEIAPALGYGMTMDRDSLPKISIPRGFSIEWLKLPKEQSVSRFRLAEKQVLIPFVGSAELVLNGPGQEVSLPVAAKDTVSVPGGVWRQIRNTADEDTEIMVVTAGDGRKRPEWAPEVVDAAAKAGRTIDASGYVAPMHLVPTYAFGKD
ncbi:MAG: hypothetical protein H6895_03655 [Defluviimonas sp.]|uniref:hypothetical protein n=1 Tax=Albidovulum sp. TaxID=1872424 RepID=UPI001E191C45|nr:hypothetical protein [Paracoccaceae bacterium]MCC0063167.1 hypothetical protein [Defluviimonas sp.]